MRSLVNVAAISMALGAWSSTAVADAPIGLCLNWLDGVSNGQTAESCTGPLQERYQSDISNVERLRLERKAEERGLDIFLVLGHEDEDAEQETISFGHVSLIRPPENPVAVDGPSLEDTLRYMSQISMASEQFPYVGGVRERVDYEYSVDDCWITYTKTQYCHGNLWQVETRTFDLREADLRITSRENGALQRADRQVYRHTTTRHADCTINIYAGESTYAPLPEPRVNEEFDSFYFGPMKNRRSDYAQQMQRSLFHLARICGAAEEQLLFD